LVAFQTPFKLCFSLHLKRHRQYFLSLVTYHLNTRLFSLRAVETACHITCKAKLRDLLWSDTSLTAKNPSLSWLYSATEAVLYFNLRTMTAALICSLLL
jgi:hypothetical protein